MIGEGIVHPPMKALHKVASRLPRNTGFAKPQGGLAATYSPFPQKETDMNKTLIAIALVTGVLSGIWAGAAPAFNLSVWAGFAGCTTYFACGKQGWAGLRMTLLTNVIGIIGGYIITNGSEVVGQMMPDAIATGIVVAVIVVFMVFCTAVNPISFVPGIFIGCFSYFAIDGNWQLLLPSIVAGAFLGAACERGGTLLGKKYEGEASDQQSEAK